MSDSSLRLDSIDLLVDFEVRSAALQMALDEALLKAVSAPLLRVYRWSAPCITLGYFERWESIANTSQGLEITRRWTGGGSVVHGTDWPYSILFPARHPCAEEASLKSYHRIHAALATCLTTLTPPARLAAIASPKISSACFENPVRFDLVQGDRKIAGAAQKRSRFGLLHQGSVQLDSEHHPNAQSFAAALAKGVRIFTLSEGLVENARSLSLYRYANPVWIAKR